MTLAESDLQKLASNIARKAKIQPDTARQEARELVRKVYFEAGRVFEMLEKDELIRGSGVSVARSWADAVGAEIDARWRK